ncbi:MAG: hypothetical protein HY673_18500 [Chloroflexi bacterium]|nr:hypothetical protein [Chloroflexota bacterium]
MVERILEKKRGQEPQETKYDIGVKALAERMQQKAEGKIIIKGNDISYEQNRQGVIKFLLHRTDWDKVSTPGWHIFINHIQVHSGKHVHQGGLSIFVLDAEGYTVVDGVRYDWEAGDLIVLPVKPGGIEHQHFNKDPDGPTGVARLLKKRRRKSRGPRALRQGGVGVAVASVRRCEQESSAGPSTRCTSDILSYVKRGAPASAPA